jgi:26S proteasome regulatory subunit N7
MAPAYEAICEELGWDVDAGKLEALEKANQQRLEQLDAAIKDAEQNLGDVEVREARAAKADYLCKIGEPCYVPLDSMQTHVHGYRGHR